MIIVFKIYVHSLLPANRVANTAVQIVIEHSEVSVIVYSYFM